MAIVDYEYYSTVYLGQEADADDFPAFEARAEDIIGAITRWQVSADTIADFSPFVRVLVKKAICTQVDFFAVNGFDSVTGNDGRGFTVGKVTVNSGSGAGQTKAGSMVASISPMAKMYLEQTGLLNPAVPVAGGRIC